MSGSSTQAFLQSLAENNNCVVAAFTVYLFDRCITFDQEVKYIWSRGYSFVSALYILLQLATIVQFSLQCFQDLVSLDCDRAYPVFIGMVAIGVLYNMITALISALRVYALYPQNRLVPITVFALGLVQPIYLTYEGVTAMAIFAPPPVGCVVATFSSLTTAFVAASVATTAVADGIVLVATWLKTYKTIRFARQQNINAPLSVLLLRDGTIHFGLLIVLASLSFVFYITEVFSGFNYFSVSFSSIILTRFFLGLREVGQSTTGTPSSRGTQTQSRSELRFTQGVGALGGSLSFAGDSDDDDGDDDDDISVDEQEDVEDRLGEHESSEESRDSARARRESDATP